MWIKTGKGKFATYTLAVEGVSIALYPPAAPKGSWVAYIDDRLFCNTYSKFDDTVGAVRLEIERRAAVYGEAARVLRG